MGADSGGAVCYTWNQLRTVDLSNELLYPEAAFAQYFLGFLPGRRPKGRRVSMSDADERRFSFFMENRWKSGVPPKEPEVPAEIWMEAKP